MKWNNSENGSGRSCFPVTCYYLNNLNQESDLELMSKKEKVLEANVKYYFKIINTYDFKSYFHTFEKKRYAKDL